MAEREKRPTGLAAAIAKVNAKHNKEENRSGSLEAALAILADHGVEPGRWSLDVKAQLERMMAWYGYSVPLFVRVYAFLKLSTLGYLPSAGGVRKAGKAFVIDDRFRGHCSRLNGLLAVVETTGKKIVSVSPAHIRNAINEATVREFTEQEGREPNAAEMAELLQTAHDIRRAVEFLEAIGMCVRTDDQNVTFEELRQSDAGRAKLKTLSGDNKIRIYLYLIPKPTTVRRGVSTATPSNVISIELKPLYKLYSALKLDIDPTAFAFDGDLQATLRTELDYRQKLLSERDEELRNAILVKYPSAQSSAASNSNGKGEKPRVATHVGQTPSPSGAAEKTSTASNPTGKQGMGTQPGEAPTLNGPANRGAVEQPKGAETEELVSKPRQRAAAPASSSDAWVDQAFANHLRAAFVNAGKSAPSTPQIAQAQKDLPDDQEARLMFVDQLRPKMSQIRGPGVLLTEVPAFTAAWPLILAKKEAQFAQQQPEVYDPAEMLALTIEQVREMPNHVEAETDRASIEKARLEDPALYEAAMQWVESREKRRVS